MNSLLETIKTNPQVKSIAITGALMSLTKVIDFSKPYLLLPLRISYAVVTLIQVGLFFYTKTIIQKKNDLTVLKYVEPASPISGREHAKFVATTIREYDLNKLLASFKQMLITICTTMFMHLYMGYAPPLLFQLVSAIRGFLDENEMKIHLLNKPATDDLKRPFKSGGLLASYGQVLTDKRSVEEAELTKLKPN
ncbi:pho88 family protein [Schizosaccharomyces cryophilus OY26]|uniref:Pho88 family protein n=1 Tax=Schizosaccharomyces cryophilus (strain OY26 / ATCC MYA-4695 / CBS 11777 / NBRC 106824 / NRRL Y48691) TaxID=653667 RepID=S9W6R7_SCHCR|nr:pho88 family protein [Schizosaccharomyces cryophilus OY26]EPY54244.1 pho88 family protein [Schizosaccharomyces cryophilus OY26]